MPFTLAHPAAVLPLRRFCPRYFSLSALIVGSIVPDAGYLSGRFRLDEFSHHFWGIFGFSLPVGMVMLAIFFGFRRRLVEFLPESQQRIFLPLCQTPIPSVFVMVISILVGAMTHLAWDSFTHTNGWLVQNLPLLQYQLVKLGNHRLMICHILWYACSFGGVAYVCHAYLQWRRQMETPLRSVPDQTHLIYALFVGLLVLPIEVLHHLINSSVGFALVGLCSLALVIGVGLSFGNQMPARPQKDP